MQRPTSVPLEGTKKDAARAEQIRADAALDELQEQVLLALEGGLATQLGKTSAREIPTVAGVFARLKQVASAAWWIEHRAHFRERSADYHDEVWAFLNAQFGGRRFCGEATDAPVSMASRAAEALATHVRGLTERVPPRGELLRLVNRMPVDLACIVEADAVYVGLVRLGGVHLRIRPQEHARELLELAGGSEAAAAHDQLLTLASSSDDGAHVVVGYDGAGGEATAYLLDLVEERIEPAPLVQWLDQVLAAGEPGSDAAAIAALLPHRLEQPGKLTLVPTEQAVWEQADRQPPPELQDLLRKGGHQYFLTSRDGTAVSIHSKGVRFVGKTGTCKAKNVKGAWLRKATLDPSGSHVMFWMDNDMYCLTLPGGQLTQFDFEQLTYDYGHLGGDRLVLTSPGEVRLVEREGDQLHELHRIASADIPAIPTTTLCCDGRIVYIPNDDHEGRQWTAVLLVRGDELRLLDRLPEVLRELREGPAGVTLARSDAACFEVQGIDAL